MSVFRVTKQFKEDFDLVAKHYQLEECGELNEVKEHVRNHLADAMVSFAAMAAEIRNGGC